MNRYDEIRLYTENELNKFYDGYIENIYNPNIFELKYIHPKNIRLHRHSHRKWDIIAQKDKYINKYKNDKIELAKDILANGNYFPIWCYIENDEYVVAEGVHRIDSIHLAISQGIWKDQKVFCIIIDRKFDYSHESNFSNVSKLKNPIIVNFPAYSTYLPNVFKQRFSNQFKRFNNNEILKTIKSDGPYPIMINTKEEYFNIAKIYHKLLRHSFFKFQDQTGIRIKARFDLK